VKKTSVIVGTAFSCLVAVGNAYAETPEPTPALPTTTSVDGAAGARGEETYFPGPGGGELESGGPPPLESTGLEDGPGSCKCSSALGSHPGAGAIWLALGLATVAAARRRRNRPCQLLQG
jgi:MYXO-CTERM domain-containing protein